MTYLTFHYALLDVTVDVQLGIITTKTHIVLDTPFMPQFNKSFGQIILYNMCLGLGGSSTLY